MRKEEHLTAHKGGVGDGRERLGEGGRERGREGEGRQEHSNCPKMVRDYGS